MGWGGGCNMKFDLSVIYFSWIKLWNGLFSSGRVRLWIRVGLRIMKLDKEFFYEWIRMNIKEIIITSSALWTNKS